MYLKGRGRISTSYLPLPAGGNADVMAGPGAIVLDHEEKATGWEKYNKNIEGVRNHVCEATILPGTQI